MSMHKVAVRQVGVVVAVACTALILCHAPVAAETGTGTPTPATGSTPEDSMHPELPQEELEQAFRALAVMPVSPAVPLSDFSLQNLSGETVTTQDLRGQFVWINLWSLQCPPCVNELPAMESLWDEYRDTGLFTILAINIGDARGDIVELMAEKRLSLPVLLDQNGAIWRMYGSGYFPTNLFVDPQGLITGAAIGARQWENKKFRSLLDEFTTPQG